MAGKAKRTGLTYRGWTVAMMVCRCGDVFQRGGMPDEVRTAQDEWSLQHRDCATKPREGRKVFWLSFCDGARPKGEQFLGVCLVDVTGEDAEKSSLDVMMRFPFAQQGSEWIAAAVEKAHRLGCNPGGEVAAREIPADHPNLAHYTFGVLMDRATVDRIDAAIAAQALPVVAGTGG